MRTATVRGRRSSRPDPFPTTDNVPAPFVDMTEIADWMIGPTGPVPRR